MKTLTRLTLAATLCNVLAAAPALAESSTMDEMVVYGSRSTFAIVLDLAPLRIDARESRSAVGESVRGALAAPAGSARGNGVELANARAPSRG